VLVVENAICDLPMSFMIAFASISDEVMKDISINLGHWIILLNIKYEIYYYQLCNSPCPYDIVI
jgi:hypothetical protein